MEPEKPSPSDCCGSGCTPCVFDIYERQLQSWQDKKAGHTQERSDVRSDLLSETRFKPFRLIRKIRLTEDVYSFTFRPVEVLSGGCDVTENINGVLPYSIGQHLVLRRCMESSNKIDTEVVTDQDEPVSSSQIITRAYTPITIAAQEVNCCFEIFAKLYDQGVMSAYLKESSVDDILYWRGPYGDFKYTPNSFRYILMLCVGTGLAPMVPIVTSIVNEDSDDTQVHLMYGIRNINHVILRDKLRSLTQYWNFTLEYYCSEEVEENRVVKFGEKVVSTRINRKSISEYLIGKRLEQVLAMVCGTDSFTASMKNYMADLGLNVGNNVYVF